MINKRKNVCYVITIFYEYRKSGTREIRQQKFLSQHQFDTKRFKEFERNYFKGVSGFDGYCEEYGRQWTVGRNMWPKVKNEVLEGITEKEKCY